MIVWEDFIQLFFFSTLSARTGLLGVLSCWRGCKVEQMQSLLGSKCRQQPSYLISQHPPGLWETGGHQRTRATNLFISVALSVHDALPFCARTPDLFDIILLLVFYRSTSFFYSRFLGPLWTVVGRGERLLQGHHVNTVSFYNIKHYSQQT